MKRYYCSDCDEEVADKRTHISTHLYDRRHEDYFWQSFREEIENGLGWSASEGMDGPFDHYDAMVLLDDLIGFYRENAS